jgi:hypothetical protein
MESDSDYNCFSCLGKNIDCAGKSYTPYADDEICLHKMIAKKDEARLKLGDFEGIRMKKELAVHLMNNGQTELSLKVLPK